MQGLELKIPPVLRDCYVPGGACHEMILARFIAVNSRQGLVDMEVKRLGEDLFYKKRWQRRNGKLLYL